ncbi:MAG: PhzF family phenazine biosynthesis protein [Candidatus Methanoperedens sp.]|nr:PhzF family phenazine biosynthesis protein [Candidatus Methanoperedens sp.]CAG1002231.1 trans-2,3-dihydro-3-hydroxyanthranilate isomerase [Methanosarcinales archaeon]
MGNLTFYIVDVFAEEKFTGNQLAIVKDADGLSNIKMQQIAREINFSETTFILSNEKRNGGYDVRIFTPKEEVPFAGHPALGTAYVIQHEIIKKPVETIILNFKIGQIPVNLNDIRGVLWMKQKSATLGMVFDAGIISDVLNIDASDIDHIYPVREVSTGLPFIIVPIKTLEALKKSRIDREKYFELIRNSHAKALLVFCPETIQAENDINVRVFAQYYGITEDPATGSGNGCLAGYLVKYNYFKSRKIDIRVEQGFEIGRPSLIYLRGEEKVGEIEVLVGGKVQIVASGEFVDI